MRSRVQGSVALLSLATLSLALAPACGPKAEPPITPGGTAPPRCDTSRALTEPDLVGWESSARGLLNSQRRYGAIAVRFEAKGCDVDLEVLTRCIVPTAKYEYTPYFASEKKVAHDQNELYAKIPIGAATLSGALKQGESLRADTANVGVLSLPPETTFKASDLKGPDCARATHVVGRLYLGAFAIATGQSRDIEAAVSVFNLGAGGKSSSLRSIGREEGDLEDCNRAKADGKEHPSCAVPLRLGLLPLLDVTAAVGAGAQATTFTFDGVKLGDPAGRLFLRPAYKNICDIDPTEDSTRQLAMWVPKECRGGTFPEGTGFFVVGPKGDKSAASMPVETFGVVGGTYFNTRSTFPLQVGDPEGRAAGVFGAPLATFDLGNDKAPALKVQRHRNDVSVVVGDGKVVGYVVGKAQDHPGESTVWGTFSQVFDRYVAGERRERTFEISGTPQEVDAKKALLATLEKSRAGLCERATKACKAKDAPLRDCVGDLAKRYEMELKPKCIKRSQAWVDCMAAKLDASLKSCIPLKVSGCEEEEESVGKCH